MGRIMSCPPSVCRSVNFSCLLHNSNTVQDIVMKLGTNINRHQTMYREQELTLHLHFLQNYGPLKVFLWKLCQHYNLDTVQNIFLKLCTNINHHQMTCRDKEPELHLHYLRNYAPLKFFLWKSCQLCNFNTVQNRWKGIVANSSLGPTSFQGYGIEQNRIGSK